MTTRDEEGEAAEVIVETAAADKNTLIVMATHGRSGLNRFLLGSIAEKVLRATVNPLLLVKATEPVVTEGEAPLTSIVVPLDGSDLAESRAAGGRPSWRRNSISKLFWCARTQSPMAPIAPATDFTIRSISKRSSPICAKKLSSISKGQSPASSVMV